MKKIDPNSPMRPRNVNRRLQKEKKQAHKRIMQSKREAEKNETTAPPKKVFHKETVDAVKKRIQRLKQTIQLPLQVKTLKRGTSSVVLVQSRDGKQRQLFPDRPPRHRILCHGCVAKAITSNVCVFSKITQHEEITDGSRRWIDGSWTIAPCTPAMLRGTTVQHVRRRRFFFLHRYHYEISFDGRVQPAAMFYDYDIDPVTKKYRFFITHEFVKVKNTDHENDFFRFWRDRPADKNREP